MITKKNIPVFPASALLLMLMGAACSNVTEVPDASATGNDDNRLRLSSITLVQDTEETPRGVVTTSGLNAIRLYATNVSPHTTYTGGNGSSTKGYADFTRSGNNWQAAADGEKIIIGENPPIIHAFHPATLEVTNDGVNAHTIPVTIRTGDDFNGTAQPDYLYAPPVTLKAGDKTVAVTLKHALAKVSLRIEKAANVNDDVTITKVEILSKSNALHTGANLPMSLDDGSIKGLVSTAAITLTGNYELKETESLPNVTCLTAPAALPASDLSFRITLSGYAQPLTTTPVAADRTWEAGKHYVYHISVSKLEAGFTGMKVYGWQSDANQNTGIGI